MKKHITIILIIIIATVALMIWFRPSTTPENNISDPELKAINKEINDLETIDLDSEFQEIDKEIDNL